MRKVAKKSKAVEQKKDVDEVEKPESEDTESTANGIEDSSDDKGYSPKKRGRPTKKAKAREYEVENIIDSTREKGKLLYLIRWKGYSSANDTWEPESVVSCPELITAFNARKAIKKKSTKRKTSVEGEGKSSKKKKTKSASSSSKTKLQDEFDYEEADSNEEYEVDKILEVHHKKTGEREFLIHWKGWSTKHDSWEPEDHLNCGDLIEKFMQKVEQMKLDGPGSGGRFSSGLRVAPKTTERFTLSTQGAGRRLSRRNANQQRVHYNDAE